MDDSYTKAKKTPPDQTETAGDQEPGHSALTITTLA